MKRKRYSEEKIIAILKEHDAGASVPDLSRRYRKLPLQVDNSKVESLARRFSFSR